MPRGITPIGSQAGRVKALASMSQAALINFGTGEPRACTHLINGLACGRTLDYAPDPVHPHPYPFLCHDHRNPTP